LFLQLQIMRNNPLIVMRIPRIPEEVDLDGLLRFFGGFSDDITGILRRFNYEQGTRHQEVYLEVISLSEAYRLSQFRIEMFGIHIRFEITNLKWERIECEE